MAVQSKTLVNDLGSAVVDELASQLNRAACVTPMALLQVPSGHAVSSGSLGDVSFATGHRSSAIMFHAPEDCFVTSIKLMSIGAQLDESTAANNSIVILQVPKTWNRDNGSGVASAADQIVVANGVNGNSVAVALGAGVATYTLRFLSDGTPFTDANGCDLGQIFDLFDITAAGSAAADEYQGTLIAGTHGATDAVSLPSGGFAMAAGDTLVFGIENNTGSACSIMAAVGYRPVKDSLSLSPSFTQKTFSSKAR